MGLVVLFGPSNYLGLASMSGLSLLGSKNI